MLAKPLDIRFGQVVTSVRYGSNGVEVRTQGGGSFSADACVITVSLGVLKVKRHMFPSRYISVPIICFCLPRAQNDNCHLSTSEWSLLV